MLLALAGQGVRWRKSREMRHLHTAISVGLWMLLAGCSVAQPSGNVATRPPTSGLPGTSDPVISTGESAANPPTTTPPLQSSQDSRTTVLFSPTFAVVYGQDYLVEFFDDDPQVVGQVRFDQAAPFRSEWATTDCSLLISTTGNGSIDLVRYGQLTMDTELVTTSLAHAGDYRTFPSLSSDGTWVGWTHVLQQTEPISHEEFGVEITMLHSSGSVILTDDSGPWRKGGAWSPTGAVLAFSQLDADGASELFAYDAPGQRKRLVARLDKSYGPIGPISWSGDGASLAFASGPEGSQGVFWSSLWVVDSLLSPVTRRLTLPEGILILGDEFWFNEDSTQIGMVSVATSGSRGILIIDVDTSRILWDSLTSIPGTYVQAAIPLGSILRWAILTGDNKAFLVVVGSPHLYPWTSSGNLTQKAWTDIAAFPPSRTVVCRRSE